MKLKGYDACAGLGSFHLAMSRAGHEIVGACEINERLRQLYERNYGIKCDGDIYGVDIDAMPDFDVLFGGTPCQSFAAFGKGLGLNDPRGQLFKRMLEIADKKQPEWVVLENVANLKSGHRAAFNTMLRHFENLGYRMNYAEICPTDLGVPQIRNRIFIIGWRNGIPAVPCLQRSQAPDLRDWLDDSDALTHSDACNDALDEWTRITSRHPQQRTMRMEDYLSPRQVARHPKSYRTLYIQSVATPFKHSLARPEPRGIIAYPPHVSPTLQHASLPAIIVAHPHRHIISVRTAARLQSMPFGMLDGLTMRQKYAALGNGINVKCAEAVVATLGRTAGSSMLVEE